MTKGARFKFDFRNNIHNGPLGVSQGWMDAEFYFFKAESQKLKVENRCYRFAYERDILLFKWTDVAGLTNALQRMRKFLLIVLCQGTLCRPKNVSCKKKTFPKEHYDSRNGRISPIIKVPNGSSVAKRRNVINFDLGKPLKFRPWF